MGSIAKRGNVWRARYRTPEGKDRNKSFARKVDAQAFLATVEVSKLTGAYVDPGAGRLTLRSYAEQWRSVQVHRPSTVAQVETNLRRHLYPVLGDRPIGAIRPSEVQAWVKGLSADLSPASVELNFRYAVAIFRAAVADRIITTTPCTGVRLPKQERRQVDPLSVEVVEVLHDAMPGRYRALITLGAGTGLRQGEALGLTVDRVDFLRRTLVVDRQLSLVPGAGPVLSPPKTAASYRTLPLPNVVLHALSEHLSTFGEGPDRLIFSTHARQPVARNRFSTIWRPAAQAAGIPEGIGFHALRHFYASLLIRHGESVKGVQARLGHASAAETLDTYSHLWPDSEDRTRTAVDEVLGRPQVTAETEARGG